MVNFNDPRLARPLWRGRTNVDAYTIAWIEHAEQIVRDEHPDIAHDFVVTQGSYQGTAGDPDSGTTHRLGGAVDLRWCGHAVCYLALRRAGGFVWHRTPSQGEWPDHFHGAPLGHPYVDDRLAAQEDSYLARGNGLGGVDDGPRLTPIPRPVWPWPPEDDMADPKTQAQLDRIEMIAKAAAADAAKAVKIAEALRKRARVQTARIKDIVELGHDATEAQLEQLHTDVADVADMVAALDDQA